MKKTLLALAFASAGLLAVPAAFAQDQSASSTSGDQKAFTGWYLDGDLGASRISKGPYNGNNYAGGLTGGYRWAVSPDMSVGAELGYVYLGKQDARSGYEQAYYANGGSNETRSNLRGATLGGALRWNLVPNWYINLRAGAFDAHGSGLSDSSFAPVRRSFSNNLGYYAGIGTGWDINQHWGVGLNYNYYQVNRGESTINGQRTGTRVGMDTSTLTASAEYRF